jgi:hypothetical protein
MDRSTVNQIEFNGIYMVMNMDMDMSIDAEMALGVRKRQ